MSCQSANALHPTTLFWKSGFLSCDLCSISAVIYHSCSFSIITYLTYCNRWKLGRRKRTKVNTKINAFRFRFLIKISMTMFWRSEKQICGFALLFHWLKIQSSLHCERIFLFELADIWQVKFSSIALVPFNFESDWKGDGKRKKGRSKWKRWNKSEMLILP